ncbi:glycosyltransferase family 4 protein [Thermodesulfobacteriota bacterium]
MKKHEGVHHEFVPIVLDRIFLELTKPFFKNNNATHPLFASKWYYPRYALKVAKDLRNQGCDIVHVHNFHQFVPFIRDINSEVKIVLHMQCEWLTQLDKIMIEKSLQKTDMVIGCSEYITETIRRRFPRFSDRCVTVYNGVDSEYFTSSPQSGSSVKKRAKRLLYVGRISPEKGLHILLDAFQKVADQHPQVQLELIGPIGSCPIEFIVALSDNHKVSNLETFYSDKYISNLKERIPSRLRGQVSFIGCVPHAELPGHYQEADVFIFPSVWDEPFGIPTIEAMAMELPVIATRAGGLVEIIQDCETGIVVEPNNADTLARAIISLLKDKTLRRQMGIAGRRRVVEHFTWEQSTQALLNSYRRLIRKI